MPKMGGQVGFSPFLAHRGRLLLGQMVAGGKSPAFQMQGEGGQVVRILTCTRIKDTEESGVRYAAGKAHR